MLCQRLKNQYVQNWGASLENSSKLEHYRKYKTYFCLEDYLNSIVNDNLRVQLCRFRTSSHMLENEMGRFASVARDCRICKLCSLNQIESEYHFLLCCPMYRCLRTKYFGNIHWPSLHKFVSIMSCKTKSHMLKLSMFIRDAFKMRQDALNI